jgi:hypothetical protein
MNRAADDLERKQSEDVCTVSFASWLPNFAEGHCMLTSKSALEPAWSIDSRRENGI